MGTREEFTALDSGDKFRFMSWTISIRAGRVAGDIFFELRQERGSVAFGQGREKTVICMHSGRALADNLEYVHT